LSNVCAFKNIGLNLLEKHQDRLFKELTDFALLEASNDIESLIHESAISLFFNLTSAYHLEHHVI